MDAAGNTNLTLTVNGGDGSKPEQIRPGLEPFALKHKYRHRGTCTVQATWSDDHGLSKSRDLIVVVGPHGARVAAQPEQQRRHSSPTAESGDDPARSDRGSRSE